MKVNIVKKTAVIIFIFSLAVIVTLTMLSFGGCKKVPVIKDLNVYVWEGYLPEAAIKMFEEEAGLKLNITLATDNAMTVSYTHLTLPTIYSV